MVLPTAFWYANIEKQSLAELVRMVRSFEPVLNSAQSIRRHWASNFRRRLTRPGHALEIPDYRLDTPEKPEIQFEEQSPNSPEATHSWFNFRVNYGRRLVDPKSEA